MFSGKTSELVRRVGRFKHARHTCLVIKYSHDRRYSDEHVSTHDRLMLPAVACERLSDVSNWCDYDVVGVDEGQFFPDLVEFCETAANSGKIVIVAALDGTFQRQMFGRVCELVPIAESIVKLTAVCAVCHGDASFSKRTTDETAVELIGGADKYIPVCRQCFFAADSSQSHAAATSAAAAAAAPPAVTPTKAPAVPAAAIASSGSTISAPTSALFSISTPERGSRSPASLASLSSE
jgi:thymidine kinase